MHVRVLQRWQRPFLWALLLCPCGFLIASMLVHACSCLCPSHFVSLLAWHLPAMSRPPVEPLLGTRPLAAVYRRMCVCVRALFTRSSARPSRRWCRAPTSWTCPQHPRWGASLAVYAKIAGFPLLELYFTHVHDEIYCTQHPYLRCINVSNRQWKPPYSESGSATSLMLAASWLAR